ncbi:glycosyltransferase family 4 protein [Wenyingzhuangia aestuarii]|uniref:glycosyltransferase family 4 protein n=1 Tax=Wenyingzhuangia aestuarii TaxID=1647582 RepID=UPI00143C7432|nr:glycosyltransferase family 4 protein [Wenyingzhuangia aestuarii]NJB83257.1 glycosyltransferase involved in cell wall biosynthesis [Wenyingzhuangia aestuarii]
MGYKILAIYGNQVYYGHERSNMQVFNTLTTEGYEFVVLVNKKGIAKQAKQVLDQKEIAYSQISYPDWTDMRKPFTIIKTLRYLGKVVKHNVEFLKQHKKVKPDYIYIANDFMYINLIPALLLINTKVVYRLGDAPVVQWKPFKFLWRNYIVKRTHKFVCISKYIHNKLIEAGRSKESNDIVIYNFPPERIEKILKPIDFIKKGLVFSYLGQIIKIKGVSEFIDAAIAICEKHNDVYFLLAGSLEYDKDFSQLQINKVKNNNLQDRIIFLGNIENIKDFFKKTDVLVTPSIKEEPLGNVLVEAKENSTPSIIFNSGGMPELIDHEVNGYICKNKTAFELEKAIEYYINIPEVIKKHGTEAKRSISKLGIGEGMYKENWLSVFK